MIAELLVELLLHPAAPEQRAKTQTKRPGPAHRRHGRSPVTGPVRVLGLLTSVTDRSIPPLLTRNQGASRGGGAGFVASSTPIVRSTCCANSPRRCV